MRYSPERGEVAGGPGTMTREIGSGVARFLDHLTVEPGIWAALKTHWKNTQSGTAIENEPVGTRA